ncbi:GNAT family N-acetyltransferase [Bacillus sp. DJP31]|uniref:GNAT family N-acetyltransferase n=1 Tax=Bacillus sp. DJP31 TaxID=3409789 RepID=UPI003BB7F0C2
MTAILDTDNHKEIIEANLLNRTVFLKSFRDRAVDISRVEIGLQWFVSTFQNVLIFDFDTDVSTVMKKIQEVKDQFEGKIEAICCLVHDFSKPNNLKQQLLQKGFVHADDLVGMSLKLETRNIPVKTSKLNVKKVEDEDSQNMWVQIICQVFELEEYKDSFKQVNVEENYAYQHYIGYENGVAVAVISLLLAEGVAGIYWVGTTEIARGKGYATELMERAHAEAISNGYHVAVLQSSKEGLGLYERLGYKKDYIEESIEWYE